LGSSVEHYNRAIGSLERKVLPGARKFVELGIRPKKIMEPTEALESLPRELTDESDESDATASGGDSPGETST
jgi:DNA recombination protein RmuC